MSKRTEKTEDPKTTAATETESKTPSLEGTLKELLGQMKALNIKVDGHIKGCNDRLEVQDERLDRFDTRLKRVEEHLGISAPAPAEKKPAKKSSKKTEGEATAKTEAEAKSKAGSETAVQLDGVRRAYVYRNLVTKMVYVTSDIWAAKQGGSGEYDPVWAFYKNGQVDHILSTAEITELFGAPVA